MLQRPALESTQQSPHRQPQQILWWDLIWQVVYQESWQQEHDLYMGYAVNQQQEQRVPVEQPMCTGYIPEFLLMLQQEERLMDMAYILQMEHLTLMGLRQT